MLLEMPFFKWSDSVVNEVCKMQSELGIQVVLAHIDRYFPYFDNAKLFKLKSYRVMLQANADPFLRFLSGHRLFKLMHLNSINLLGSDFHDLGSRCAHMDEAIQHIKDRGFGSKLDKVMVTASDLLRDAKTLM